MLWVGFVVLGSIFELKILEKKWSVLSKEEERRRGNRLRKRERERERERKCG